MPDLRPFRGLRYAAAPPANLSDLVCPPYDVISVGEREELLAVDPHNAVRLELPGPTPTSATDSDYRQAAGTLSTWIADGTLRRDARPMVYILEQEFLGTDGTPRVAHSFFCELGLEGYGPTSGVRPHEHTIAAPREHRFQLLSAVRTHLSPVLLIYDDSDGRQAELLSELRDGLPVAVTSATSATGTSSRLWAVDFETSSVARELLGFAASRPLTIADGHHRYETALRYRDTADTPPGASHVLALLYGSQSGGLALAPWHRIISGVSGSDAALARAVDRLDGRPIPDSGDLQSVLAESVQPGRAVVWTRKGGAILRWPASESARLDVSVVSDTLPAMVGSTEAELTQAGRLAYTHDAREAVAAVDEGRADISILLRATPIDQVLAVAAAGEFMPAKSTYFYPKAATGLVFDPLSA